LLIELFNPLVFSRSTAPEADSIDLTTAAGLPSATPVLGMTAVGGQSETHPAFGALGQTATSAPNAISIVMANQFLSQVSGAFHFNDHYPE